MPQPSLTLLSVTGHSDYTRGSMFALINSYQQLKDRIVDLRAVLVSPDRPADLPDYIQHLACRTFDYYDYSSVMVNEAGHFFQTDFALIVQHDGWVLDGSKWRDAFFDYDYLGSVIPGYVSRSDNDVLESKGTPFWQAHYDEVPAGLVEPQNGGFCLRSRRLYNALSTASLGYGKLVAKQNRVDEDVWISGFLRKELEAKGCRFAPRKIAFEFSLSCFVSSSEYDKRFPEQQIWQNSLGIHITAIALVGINRVLLKSSHYINAQRFDEDWITRRLLELGFELFIPVEFSPIQRAYLAKRSQPTEPTQLYLLD